MLVVAGHQHRLRLGGYLVVADDDLLECAHARRSQRVQADAGGDAVVALRQLATVVDLDPRDDVAKRIISDEAVEPLVPHLLEVGEKDGVVDVPVRVEVFPADLDLLLVHGCPTGRGR